MATGSRTTSCPVQADLAGRWRPDGDGPPCGYSFRAATCEREGNHYCVPRADRAVAFVEELCVHTKGRWARQKFKLAGWQEVDIVRPLFGEVVWSDEWDCYVRRYRVARIVLGRKTGKSELVAALVLLLLVGDDEEGAEIYGAARDTKQAGKVGDVVVRMRHLSVKLARRLEYNKNSRRMIDDHTGSWFEVITADALGELGHNPHGAYIDEVLSQRDGTLYDALRTAMGARHQPLMLLVTTETNDPSGFGAGEIDEAERVQEDPKRAPHVFAYVRKMPKTDDELERLRRLFDDDHPALPMSTDPWDERNWYWPCPSLGEFKSVQGMRDEALEARNDPTKENSFRQYQMNQRVSQVTRFLPLDLWDSCAGEMLANPQWLDPKLEGRSCDAGLDLSSKHDLTAWCLLFDDGTARWRFWLPEVAIRELDRYTDGQVSVWARDGWITATDGDVIDYQRVYDDIEADAERFAVRRVFYDKWCGEPVRQEIEERTGLEMVESNNTYERMTMPLKELLVMLRKDELSHGGHPVARWHADSLEAKSPTDDPERMRPVKPERFGSGKRIDGMAALLHAIEGRMVVAEQVPEPFAIFT